MAFQRGFKADATRLAHEVRDELGLTPFDPLDPWVLGEHLTIPIDALSSLRDVAARACDLLGGTSSGEFSAMVVMVGRRRHIVHNDSHALTRQRSNICHELAHALLLHEGHALQNGRLMYERDQEDEAHWLGGLLLVADEACLAGCRQDRPLEEDAMRYGVSTDLMRWRRNASGAPKRVARERPRRAR